MGVAHWMCHFKAASSSSIASNAHAREGREEASGRDGMQNSK
jgi:hypothetical protein